MHRKYCVVPHCFNSNYKMPEKIFFTIPMNPKLREKWMTAMGRVTPLGPKTVTFCCEDHFDVEEDVANYMQYKIMVLQEKQKMVLRLKPGVVPHKFECQKDVDLNSSPRVKQRMKKDSALEQAEDDDSMSDAPADDSAPDEVMVKTELFVEFPALPDLRTSPEHVTIKQERLTTDAEPLFSCHEEVSLPSSPLDIKEETAFEEYSIQNEEKVDHETMILKLKEENQRLTDENLRLTEKNRKLSGGIEGLLQKSEHQMTRYENQSLSENAVLKKIESEKLTLKEENQRLSRTLDAFNKASKKQAKTIIIMNERTKDLLEKIEQLKQKLKELTKERKTIRVTDLKQRIRRLKQRIEQLKTSQNNHDLTEEIHGAKIKAKDVEQDEDKSKDCNCGRQVENFKDLVKIQNPSEEKDGCNTRKRKLV